LLQSEARVARLDRFPGGGDAGRSFESAGDFFLADAAGDFAGAGDFLLAEGAGDFDGVFLVGVFALLVDPLLLRAVFGMLIVTSSSSSISSSSSSSVSSFMAAAAAAAARLESDFLAGAGLFDLKKIGV
jgi:hypothetical protein